MDRRVPWAVAADALAVLLFATLGRRSHGEGPAGIPVTAAPFLIGLAVAWVVAPARRRPWRVLTGVVVAVLTTGVGMAMRAGVFQRGTATSFIIVATVVLTGLMAGWRAVAALVAARSRPAG